MHHPLLASIRREAAFIRRRRMLRVVLEGLLAFAIPALIFAGLDHLLVFREGISMAFTALCVLIAATCFAVRLIGVWTDLPDSRDVTMIVEQLCPELMDSLICAVELIEQGRADESPFAAAVVKQVEDRLRAQRLRDTTKGQAPGVFLLAGLAIAGLIGCGVAHVSPLGEKARAHLRDRLAGTATGVDVAPGNVEIAEGDAVTITAQVKRGPDQAEILIRDGNGQHVYHMIKQTDGSHRFEMFGVTQPFTYQVLTPILDSETYLATTFPRPSIQRSRIIVTPPTYTGLPEETHEELRDVSAPVGSIVSVHLETNMPVTAELLPKNAPAIPARAKRPQQYLAKIPVADNVEYNVRLTDLQRRSVTTDRTYLIESIADFAPIIRVETPEDDAKRPIDGKVDFAAAVTDDYGVAAVDVVYSLNGNDWINRSVYRHSPNTPAQAELSPSWNLDLNGLVKVGDVIYYYFRAVDNAEPEANETATTIRFLEIRPADDDTPESDEESDQDGEQQEGSVADLIREQKLLIRETFSMIQFGSDQQRDEAIVALARAAGDLRIAAQKRLNGFQEKAEAAAGPGVSLGLIGELFEAAIAHMSQAERRMQGRLPDESLAYQQKSLGKLIELEIEMKKNAQKMKGKGKGEGEQKPQENQQKEKDREREKLEKLEELAAQIEELEDLARRQENLNREMEKAAGKQDADLEAYVEKKQEELRQETTAMRDQMRGDAAMTAAAQELSRAADSQRQAGQQMKAGQAGNAQKQGKQAAQALDRSAAMLQQMRDAMSGNALQQAGQQLQQLQQAQSQLQQQTQAAAAAGPQGRQQAKDLKQQQEALRQQLEDLMQSLNNAAAELDKDNPEAATELAKGIQEARKDNAEGAMKRAENALAYKRLDKATESQQEAADALDKLSEALRSARSKSPAATPEQLAQMLEQTMKSMQQIQEAKENNPQQVGPSVQQAAQQAQQHAQATGDGQMQENAQQLSDAAALGGLGGSPDLIDGVTAVLEANARRLQQQIALASIRRKLELSRAAGQEAPDEYRKLVDEYFRKLSQEP